MSDPTVQFNLGPKAPPFPMGLNEDELLAMLRASHSAGLLGNVKRDWAIAYYREARADQLTWILYFVCVNTMGLFDKKLSKWTAFFSAMYAVALVALWVSLWLSARRRRAAITQVKSLILKAIHEKHLHDPTVDFGMWFTKVERHP